LALIFLGGAFVRHTFNLRNKGKAFRWPLVPAALFFLAAILITSPSFNAENVAVAPAAQVETAVANNPEPQSPNNENAMTGVSSLPSNEAPSNAERLPIRSFIKGRIFYTGSIPTPEKLKVPAGCLKEQKEVFNDDILAGESKTIQNVIVYIGQGRPAFSAAPDTTEVVVDQHACSYKPKVVAAMVGQPVTFVNSDSIFHNVRSHGKDNPSFNVGMPKKGQRLVRVFNKPEFVVHAKCSVHPWMSSFIGVFDHPWFSVTREKGEYLIQGLPTGKYEVVAWHPTLGTQTKSVEIKDNEDMNLDFNFTITKK
jgi:plastocyanin